MKAAYLIESNLPFRVPVWRTEAFLFVVKMNPDRDDEEIWQYAKENDLVIVKKDKDILVKQALAGAPPNVVHVKFGNLKPDDFISRIEAIRPEVEKSFKRHHIITIYLNKIEAIK